MRAGALLLLIGLLVPVGAGASHDWVGIDLCRTYPERMPPELGPGVLPAGQGSGLLGRYCGQCHFAPGPGQHTAREWVEVVTRMALLMGVTARFAERSRPVAQPSPEERGALLAYLQEHALRPLVEPEAAPTAYRSLCGDCHAAPDPAAYPAADWPRLLTRMTGYRATMGRPPADSLAQSEVEAYLGVSAAAMAPGQGAQSRDLLGDKGRWLALGPVFLLALLGLWRWWLGQRRCL